MNYLAHFHLAGSHPHYILGGLLGDFIKGPLNNIDRLDAEDPRKLLHSDTINGIRLHRRIDAYVDNHPAFAELAQLMPSHSRRFRGIVTDLYCDYALSLHWETFEQTPLAEFIDHVLRTIDELSIQFPAKQLPNGAQDLLLRFQQHRLLERYAERPVIDNIIQRLGTKLASSDAIAELQSFLWHNQSLWESAFLNAYPDIVSEAQKTIVELDQ